MKYSKCIRIILISAFLFLSHTLFPKVNKCEKNTFDEKQIGKNNIVFTLKGYVEGFKGDKVMLATISNLRMNPINTAIAKDGQFEFNISNYKAGMYSLIFDYGIYADIIINNENIEFKSLLINKNVEDSIHFIQSEENKVYYEYVKYKKWVNYRTAYEKHQGSEWYAKDAVGNAAKLDSLKLHIDWLQKSISDKAYELYKKYSSLFVAKKLKFYLLPNFEDYRKQNKDTKYKNEFEFLQEHFFDNVDINDTNLMDVAYLNNIATVYLSNYTFPQNTTTFIKSCNYIVENLKANEEVLCSVLDVIEKQMENWYQDSVFIYLSDNYFEKGYCINREGQKEITNIANILKQLSKGKVFPNIHLKDNTGIAKSLYGVNANATLVFFWLSTCDHCEKMIPDIKKMYATYKSKGLEIFAVSMDTNKDYWGNAIKTHGLNWINVSELKGFSGDVAKQLSITRTPKLYLLDKDKKVIAHPLNTQQLQQELEEYFSK